MLGQPGAGKSVLTKVLAAELSAGGFLPIRVPLRDVDTSLDLQRQIEQAVLAATTEPVSWPRLAESAGGRMPVVLLDGFDELLQATATSQSDYLYRVADFQERERALGRAVAFVVTTRSSVADRAAPPPDTLLLRLAEFDEQRVTAWLSTWHDANEATLRTRGLRPLPPEVALRFRELAGQPLLLFLLALYDADENALQHTAALALSQSELYERLLTSFARREVRKAQPGLAPDQFRAATDQELRRLSIVAFAMLNRSAQWVTERDLEADLTAVFGIDGTTPAGLLLGRFFFVHRAQTVRGRQTLQTYEFLHATFGEYLVARYTWELLAESVARASVTASPTWNADDGLLARLLSFAALAERAPIVLFLASMAGQLPAADRSLWTATIAGLYRRSHQMSWGGPAADYRPVVARMPARYAAYGANLVLLAVIVSGGLLFSTLADRSDVDAGQQWQNESLLWHSQLSKEGWDQMIRWLTVEFLVDDTGNRDVRLTLEHLRMRQDPAGPRWFLWLRRDDRRDVIDAAIAPQVVARRLRFTGGVIDTLAVGALTPILNSWLGTLLGTYPARVGEGAVSAAEALLGVWTMALGDSDQTEVRTAYLRCASVAAACTAWCDDYESRRYIEQLLRAVEVDPGVTAELFTEILETLNITTTVRYDLFRRVMSASGAVLRRTPEPTEAARHLASFALEAARKYAEPFDDAATYRAFCAALVAGGYADEARDDRGPAHLLGPSREAVLRLEQELLTLGRTLDQASNSSDHLVAIKALQRVVPLTRELRAVIAFAHDQIR